MFVHIWCCSHSLCLAMHHGLTAMLPGAFMYKHWLLCWAHKWITKWDKVEKQGWLLLLFILLSFGNRKEIERYCHYTLISVANVQSLLMAENAVCVKYCNTWDILDEKNQLTKNCWLYGGKPHTQTNLEWHQPQTTFSLSTLYTKPCGCFCSFQCRLQCKLGMQVLVANVTLVIRII